jgi:hypothetical protein
MLEEMHQAVVRFASDELDALSRKVILGLQRLKASDIYGDDYKFKTIWDEYCHDVQQGPFEALESAWDQTIDPFIDHSIGRMRPRFGVLVSIGADYEGSSPNETTVSFNHDQVSIAVRARIDQAASRRRMDRFYWE